MDPRLYMDNSLTGMTRSKPGDSQIELSLRPTMLPGHSRLIHPVGLERGELAIVLDGLFVVSRPESHPGQQAQVGWSYALVTEGQKERVDIRFRDGAAKYAPQATIGSEDEGGRKCSLIIGAEESPHDIVVREILRIRNVEFLDRRSH